MPKCLTLMGGASSWCGDQGLMMAATIRKGCIYTHLESNTWLARRSEALDATLDNLRVLEEQYFELSEELYFLNQADPLDPLIQELDQERKRVCARIDQLQETLS